MRPQRPPQIQGPTYTGPAQSGPPVLRNGSARPTPTPAVSQTVDNDDVIKVETNIVTMPVSVLDRDGRFISGLQQRDFRIFENGVEQKLDYFQSVEQPFTVIMLIDVSPSTQFRIDEIQNAAMSFVDQLRPADRVMVIAFDERVAYSSPATNNTGTVKERNSSRPNSATAQAFTKRAITSSTISSCDTGAKAVVLFSMALTRPRGEQAIKARSPRPKRSMRFLHDQI